MSRRPPSPEPHLPGYEYEQLLGSGGFADVFLYRQFRPQRRVAIKVLLSNVLDETVRRQFDAEANVMAQMSTHPSIVTIHQAEVSADHRPYIVMEYCPRPNYGVRFRKERITVAEALRVGVQIAGAVETAHRAGILHRDIKPANILVTDYSRPALTDFGISIATGQAHDIDDSQGMSIPWSPPEFFADPPRADVRSDVFSLAATVYSMLAGQTPFEHRGQRNTASDLIHRIASEPLTPLDRPDVPPELNRVLSIAMAKDPGGRYDTALAFGRGLQQVELALSLPVTQMDVLDDGVTIAAPSHDDDELDMHTRIRKVATVDPDSRPAQAGGRRHLDPYAGIAPAIGSVSPSAGGPVSSAPASGSPAETTMPRPGGGSLTATSARAPLPEPGDGQESIEKQKTPVWPFVLLAAILVIILGVGTTLAVRFWVVPEPEARATTAINTPDVALEPPGEPTVVSFEVIMPAKDDDPASAQLAWAAPENFGESDFYQVRWKDLPENYEKFSETESVYDHQTHVLSVPPGVTAPCAEVRTVTRDGPASSWVEACLKPE